tara:strand:- start:43 stop:561 length:519 start_codon:yes stop_codon:yes gene_type:complete
MNIIYNKDSFDNAIEVDNYPWGFKFKTKRRYWIETTKRGDRLCYQTLNPKTDKWCNVKKSTYSPVELLYLNENGHVKTYGFSLYNAEGVYKFEKNIDVEKLNKGQRMKICEAKAIAYMNSKIEVEIVNTTMMSDEEKEVREKEQKEVKDTINKHLGYVYDKCLIKNDLKEVA